MSQFPCLDAASAAAGVVLPLDALAAAATPFCSILAFAVAVVARLLLLVPAQGLGLSDAGSEWSPGPASKSKKLHPKPSRAVSSRPHPKPRAGPVEVRTDSCVLDAVSHPMCFMGLMPMVL